MPKIYSVKEVAENIPSGTLGMHSSQGMLLFRPKNESDPRVKMLLEQNWYAVRGVEGVIQAYPTLEAFNELEEIEEEFTISHRAHIWVKSVWKLDDESLPSSELKKSPLFDYQQEAVQFLVNTKRAMLSLSPGLGKSLVSAYAAGVNEYENVLVVCPASLLYYWKNELEKWSDKLPIELVYDIWHREVKSSATYNRFETSPIQYWAITNPETVAKHLDGFLTDIFFDLMIVDESIMYKHRDSKRSKAMKTLAQAIDTVWLLTGAPATRYLDDMWHQFHLLKPKGYRSYWRFTRKYCIVDDNDWGSKVVANRKNAEKEIQKNFGDIYFARSQDDVLDIPDWIFEDIDIPMPPKQDKIYEKLREELRIELEGIDSNEVISINNHLSLMIRSLQVASNPLLVGAADSSGKWNALPELMEIYPGPYIVWVNFIKTGEMLRDNLSLQRLNWPTKDGKLRVALANGSTPMEDRNLMVNSFQNGELDVIVMNSQVGKFGFTLTKARTAFFVERGYDDSYYQCLHRNRRIGTTQSPVIVNMRSVTQQGRKTIDHTIHDVLSYRTGMIQKVTAGMLKEAFAR